MAASPARGLQQLREAAESGALEAFCAKHRIRILTVFGSAARGEPTAHDLDIGVMFESGTNPDYWTVIGDLMKLADANIDFVHLNRGGSLIRERALVGSIPLYESEPYALAREQTKAML